LIDGTGSAPLTNAAVLFDDGRISWTGSATQLAHDDDLRRVDVAGKYVIPGLLDANVHLLLQYDPEILLRYEIGYWDELVLEAAQVALRAGITTVFDTWGPLASLRRVRDRIDAGEATGSRIFLAGNIIGNAGPWSPDFNARFAESLNPAVAERINREWEQGMGGELPWMSAADVRRAVKEYIDTSGIDFVKYAGSAHGYQKFIVFSPDAQRAIVEEAHVAGMTAQACTMTPEALKLAIEAGVDLLQHGSTTGRYAMPREMFDLIVGRPIPCVAFLMTERYLAALPAEHPLGELYSETRAVQDGNDRDLIKAGAKLLLANDMAVLGPSARTSAHRGQWLALPDHPLLLGESHIYWLRAAIERGMDPMDALLSATRNVAQAYRKDDELGTVEPGKRADLLVLDADPLEAVENYRRIAYMVKDGEIVDRDRLPERPVLTRDEG
jgi:imidazolonepropionase-like amidohydrolase